MSNRLDTALQSLQARRDQLSEGEQDTLARVIGSFASDSSSLDDILSPVELIELRRRLAARAEPVDPAAVRAVFEKYGIHPRF